MPRQIIEILILSLATLIAPLFPILVARFRGRRTVKKEFVDSYSDRMADLSRSLAESAAEVDRVLKEMSDVSQKRESAIYELETKLKELAKREKYLQAKVESLEKVPLPAMELFVGELEKAETRGVWRDYRLFGLGVIVSAVLAIAVKLIWG